MSDGDILDMAIRGAESVSQIAISLGLDEKRPVCGQLGAELYLLAEYLKSATEDQHNERLVRKVLRDIEWMCSWPGEVDDSHPFLNGITQELRGSVPYMKAEERVRQGLREMTGHDGIYAKAAIQHFQRLTKRGIKKNDLVEAKAGLKMKSYSYDDDINMLVYNVLRRHTCCTCTSNPETAAVPQRHLSSLLLRPVPTLDSDENVYFDLIFSSMPPKNETTFGFWQAVQLMVPRRLQQPQPRKKPPKRVTFSDFEHSDASQLGTIEISHGQFCKLIRLETNARLCLTIQDHKLRRFLDSEPLEEILDHSPSISLAAVLDQYHLKPKMKAALAYILAQSVWRFYESDWMRIHWTSETIRFMRQHAVSCQGEPKVFSSKPYISVQFGDEEPEACESSLAVGEIHRYPRVRALGIMLVEIGIGSRLEISWKDEDVLSDTMKNNKMWSLARQYSDREVPWETFDFETYWNAVRCCLDPKIFTSAPFDPNATEDERLENLKKRRNILHDVVIFPLEQFLRGTGWKNELDKIESLRPQQPSKGASAYEEPPATTVTKSKPPGQKKSERWLIRIYSLQKQLAADCRVTVPHRRVRIAILDTGYDPDAVFFQPPSRRSRLVQWKDWVDDARQPEDCHGHGTHLVSLIMQMAPEADICVARVSKDQKGLARASESVAEAIKWAQSACAADIISMSFGYSDHQACIANAIRDAVSASNESVLFFAAAANFGANEAEMFPARHRCVISIRGTNSTGRFEDFNPPPGSNEARVLGTLGLDVPSACLSHQPGIDVCMKGTSVATAVAAGMAGMLLEYVRGQSSLRSTYRMVRDRLKRQEGMLALLESLSVPSLGQECCHYLAPWSLENKAADTRWSFFERAAAAVAP